MEKIILIAGKARSGKDTTGSALKKYFENKGKRVVTLAFGFYIKEYVKNISGWKGAEEDKPRKLLQEVGTDIVRNTINEDFFVNRIIDDIKVYSRFFDIVIIDDARFENEITKVKEAFNNVVTIKIERDNFVSELTIAEKNHASETSLDNYKDFDYIIKNNEGLKELKEKVIEIGDEL